MVLGRNAQFLAVKSAVSRALDWVLPPMCPVTGESVDAHGMISAEYWASLRFIARPFCPHCGIPHGVDVGDGMECAACVAEPPLFEAARAAVVYDDASKKIVLRFKHGDQVQAVRILVPWLMRAGADFLDDVDVILPVPLHRWRFLKRRYNQSAILSQSLANCVQKRSIVDGLLRIRRTPSQGGLTANERKENIKNAFVVNPRFKDELVGKKVLLVDDVFTTGATLNECTKTLLAAGAANVKVLCVARAVKD